MPEYQILVQRPNITQVCYSYPPVLINVPPVIYNAVIYVRSWLTFKDWPYFLFYWSSLAFQCVV